jgi:hypothetical protein
MHLSFMQVEYRDYVSNLQSTNDHEYRNQRRTPRVIIPDSFRKGGAEILLEDAPMAHPSVIRDAQYETLGGSKQQMDRGFAMRARITTDATTKVIPKSEAPWQRVHSDVPNVHSDTPAEHGHTLPASSGAGRVKGMRVLTQLANRRQLPQKMSRRDSNSNYPPAQTPNGSASAPIRSIGGIPLPPTRNSDANESSSCVNSGAGRSPLLHREDDNAVNTNGG